MNDEQFDELMSTLDQVFVTWDADGNETINVPGSIMLLAEAINNVARSIHRLGNADANTPLGGLEGLGKQIGQSLDGLATAVSELADARK